MRSSWSSRACRFSHLFFVHAVNANFAMACRSPAFLREQINSILKFYAPVVRDPRGGYHNQLLDDGTVYDPSSALRCPTAAI